MSDDIASVRQERICERHPSHLVVAFAPSNNPRDSNTQLHGAPAMERFIRRQNVEHYRHLLETVTDENERERILRLLEEEKRKQQAAGDKTD
jgi:hypothetical protein